MVRFLVSYLAEDLTFRVVRGLLSGGKPRHLRELARQYRASPAGISDVLQRLSEAGILVEIRRGNRRLLTLKVLDQERESLLGLFKVYESQRLLQRAHRTNKNSKRLRARLEGMDEMYRFYRGAKERA